MIRLRSVWPRELLMLAAILGSIIAARADGLRLLGTRYTADQPFPQFVHLWSENWGLRGEDGEPRPFVSESMPLGAYIHLFVQNTSATPARVQDLKLSGISLNQAIAFSTHKAARRFPASIYFSSLPTNDLARFISYGEPVWWKADPVKIEPSGFAEVIVRLRRPLTNDSVQLELEMDRASLRANVSPKMSAAFASISFSPALDKVFAYLRPQTAKPAPPKTILFDGNDLTSRSEILSDPAVELSEIIINLPHALTKGSLHFIEARFDGDTPMEHGYLNQSTDDGRPRSAAVSAAAPMTVARAWSDDFVYGMWGYVNHGKTEDERVDFYIGDLKRHNINAVMHSYGNDIGRYLSGEDGLKHSQATGIRAMRTGPSKDLNPLYYFLMDEPDAHDYAVSQLPLPQRLGTLGPDVIRTSREFRNADPATPQLLNVDNTYKPENWYMYGQLPDVYCADPYFQSQQQIAWNTKPDWAASFLKPTYVYAVASICHWACAPRPLHIILNAVNHGPPIGGFRYATPEEKTVEVFYALAGGATSLSYWWYTPYGEFRGCGASDPGAIALWRQIGLLGAQVRTAGPLLTRSCPAAVPVKAPSKLWTRTLLSGSDALILLAVNDNLASDRLGTVVVPLAKTDVSINTPNWLTVKDAFEITPDGITDIKWQQNANGLALNLGTTRVARMIVCTADSGWRSRMKTLYAEQFATTVADLLKQSESK